MKTRVGKITDKRSGDVFSYADELLTLRIGGWKCMESRLIEIIALFPQQMKQAEKAI